MISRISDMFGNELTVNIDEFIKSPIQQSNVTELFRYLFPRKEAYLFRILIRIMALIALFTSVYASENVRIGVLAFRSKSDTLKEWKPTADYLNQIESEYHFTIHPLTYPEMNEAVKNGKLDFVITNSGHYVYLEKHNHISRIATILRYKNGQWIDRFGGVIFTKSERNDIKTLDDLREKTVAAVDSESLGGYAAQMFELNHYEIDSTDLHLKFTGMPHQNVVEEVLSGKADVGFVRTDVLENMKDNAKIDLRRLKIIHPQKAVGFPYLLSTALYPEWPIAQMPQTSKQLSNEVVIALLQRLPHQTFNEGDIGWTTPLDYRDIHEIFQVLRLPPYDKPLPITLWDIYHKYTYFIWIIVFLSVLVLVGLVVEIALRRKLAYENYKNEKFLTLAGDGIHILDEGGNIVQVSDTFCQMLGYSRDEMLGMNVAQWDIEVKQNEFIKETNTLINQSHVIYSKHKRRDGTIYDSEIMVTLIKFKKQQWIYCLARDISLKLIENEKTQLASLVFEYSSDPIVITDKDSNIISINPAFTSVTGYIIDDIIGRSTKLLSSGQQSAEFYRQLQEAIATVGEWCGEIVDRDKEGALFSKWLSIRTIYDSNQKPYRRIAIFTEISDQKETKHQLWYQANFDILTGLSNRSMFMYRLDKELHISERNDFSLVLMYLDLDHFKEVNDTLGHDKGDTLLQEAAKRLLNSVRKNDLVSRLGGDEFTILINNIESLDIVNEIASKIIYELSLPFYIDNETLFISVSIGITVAPSDGNSAEVLLKNADQAMYVAKNDGRNRFHYFTHSMQETLNKRKQMIYEIREAIIKDQFVLYYQPIIELASGLIYKAEALVRWIKEDGTIINPIDFIELAEETELIHKIGVSIHKQAVHQVKQWRERIHPNFQISVNNSPVQFRYETNEYPTIIETMDNLNIPNNAVIVEITEGVLMENTPIIKQRLLEFKMKGVSVALDDFGTGYSSLSYLKRFDIDYLKIDRVFVQNLETDINDKILCEAIVAMAHKMEIQVIAEGVETVEQRDYLMSIGCDYIQGYLISRPISAHEFELFYQSYQANR